VLGAITARTVSTGYQETKEQQEHKQQETKNWYNILVLTEDQHCINHHNKIRTKEKRRK
jgi:hypothetical protein